MDSKSQEELWNLIVDLEKKSVKPKNDSRDKGIDWEAERFFWEKWNPKK